MPGATAQPTAQPSVGPSGWISLAAVYLIWGSTYFAVRIVVGDGTVAPVHLQFARSVAAAALLGVVALLLHGRRRRTRPSWRNVGLAALSGILMWAAGNGFATYAAAHASSSFIVMAMGTIPLWTVIIESVIERRLPAGREVAALLVGFGGLALVMTPGLTSTQIVDPEHAPVTLALLVAGGLTWAAGTSMQKRAARHFTTPGLTAVQFSAATVVLLVPALLQAPPSPGSVQTGQWLAFAYLVVIGSAVSLSAFAVVVRSFSPAIASSFAYVNPVVGVILGAVFLHEVVSPVSLLGLLVVLGAVGAVLAGRSR